MSWEEKYREDIMPVIEAYINQKTSSFTSRDIAEFSEELESDLVGRTLKQADIDTVLKTGNNPSTWEALYIELEDERHILEPEEYSSEETSEGKENPVEQALESLETDSIGKIYSYFRNRLEIKDDNKIKEFISEYREKIVGLFKT